MVWQIKFRESAKKEFAKVPRNIQIAINDYLLLHVISDPRSCGKALQSGNAIKLWRYRVQNYRLICKITDHDLVVLLIKIGKRDSIYKNLSDIKQ